MKVQELIAKVNDNFDFEKELIVKKYIPIMEKKTFAIETIAACTDEIDDYITVDKFKLDIYFHMNLLKLYTNLEISSDFYEMVSEYDMLCKHNILYKIIDVVAEDCGALECILDYELEALLKETSLECQAVKLVGKLNGVIDVFGEKIKSTDLLKLLPEGTDLSKLSGVLNLLK